MKRKFIHTCMGAVAVTVAIAGCSKSELTFSGDSASSTSICVDPSSKGSPTPVRRLSKRELTNTLRDLIPTTAFNAVAGSLALIPLEEKGVKFDNVDNTLSYAHIDSLFSLAESVADEIVQNQPGFFGLGACIPSSNDVMCVQDFIRGFGMKVFRRPLTGEEITSYSVQYEAQRASSRPDGVKIVIASLLQSSNFYYITETRGEPVDGNPAALDLTSYEIATRLSYALTGSTPDELLLSAASNGSLKTEQGIETQINRLIGSIKTRDHFKEYVNQLLHLEMLPAFNYSAAFLEGQSVSGLRDQVIQEAQDYVLHHMLDTDKSFTELMTSKTSFIKGRELASLYKVAPPTLSSGEIVLPAERAGLLTRAALLVSGGDEHKPFHRGQVLSSEFACAEVSRPDPDLVPEAFNTIQNSETVTTRVQLESLTSSKTCMGCHSTLNPYGFSLENFDSLGRFRTTEIKRGPAGEVLNVLTIDASVTPQLDGRVVHASGVGELAQQLADSPQTRQCFTRKWFRFSLGKREQLGPDGCNIEKLANSMNAKGESIKGMLTRIFKSNDFRTRVAPAN